GTPTYMAPEQAAGMKEQVGPATDVYALGAILYELLTGQPPFQGKSVLDSLRLVTTQDPVAPSKLTPALSGDLEAICLKCLEKAPRARYASARELADDLQRFLDGHAVTARPASRLRKAWKWARRHPQAVALAAAVAVLVIVPVVYLIASYRAQR